MRTVTFYSYKGGTGRTLLLANVAVLAARMGWKVVAIDVDLEAPGLTYKLFEEPPLRCDGLVGWLRDRFATGKAPLSLGDSLLDVELTDPFEEGGWLQLMPAGRHPSLNYFQDLIGLHLEQRINEGPGVDAFVDLQKQVLDELDPDLLLLDARTGISSTNLVTTRVLADDVIALTLDNREQLDGTRSVLRSLTPLTSLRTDEAIGLHVVLSRVAPRSAEIGSYTWTDAEREKVERVRTFLREPADPLRATLTVDRVHLLHSEPSLIAGDFLALAGLRVIDATALHIDCLSIAEAVLGDTFTDIATQAISAAPDREGRERVAGFFARIDDLTGARAAMLPGAPRETGDPPDFAARVGRLQALAEGDPTWRPDLSRALLDQSAYLADEGRPADAVAPTERAVEMYEELAATNPAFRNDLARSLNTLGACYSGAGRRTDAVGPTERAVAIREELAAADPRILADLASSLNNLGNRYSEVGRLADAVGPTERAVAIDEASVATDSARLDDLAGSLNNLGNRYSEVGRRADAVGCTMRAVAIYEELAAVNPAFLGDLAASLNNLGACYGELGQREDAVQPTRRAVAIYQQLVVSQPVFLSDLAGSLNNLGTCYGELGRSADALEQTEYGAAIREELAAASPFHLDDLAASLNNLGVCYGELRRHAEAVVTAQRAVAIYEQLAAVNAAFLVDLARALSNLAACHSNAGREGDATEHNRRSVELLRPLASELPAARMAYLVAALRWLAAHSEALGDIDAARAATAEADQLYEQMAVGE